jgi:hypothetical protein
MIYIKGGVMQNLERIFKLIHFNYPVAVPERNSNKLVLYFHDELHLPEMVILKILSYEEKGETLSIEELLKQKRGQGYKLDRLEYVSLCENGETFFRLDVYIDLDQ